MRRNVIISAICGALAMAATATVLLQVAGPSAANSKPMAQVMPAGPLLYVEAKDFGSLLKDWNASPEKQTWLKSDNYQVFSRSKLFLRLKHDQGEFAAAAGFPPDMAMLDQVAGSESAFAVYDIGKLEFLYITRMPEAHAAETVLWQKRGDYQPRKAGEASYYVRVEPESKRTVAFAVSGDYLLLATREDLLAGALGLLSGKGTNALTNEGWFTKAVAAAAKPGDLRLVMNLDAIVATPQFNSYWIQENVGEIKGKYSAGVSDLFRTPGEYREERVLLLKDSQPRSEIASNPDLEAAVGQALRLVPADSGFYESWAKPSTDELMHAISTEILAPHFGPRPVSKLAPNASISEGSVGSESDLEVRIDEARPAAPVSKEDNPLKTMLVASDVSALLKLKDTRPTSDGVFVQTRSAVAVIAKTAWNTDQVKEVLQRLTENMTSARLGTTWTARKQGSATYFELDGLSSLSMFADKNLLLISNSPAMLQSLLAGLARPVDKGALYASRFEHKRERGNFIKMMCSIEGAGPTNAGSVDRNPEHGNDSTRQPKFFSDNIGGLSRTLARVESESIEVHDMGDREVQTVRYHWAE
jgi:hypothetical protein